MKRLATCSRDDSALTKGPIIKSDLVMRKPINRKSKLHLKCYQLATANGYVFQTLTNSAQLRKISPDEVTRYLSISTLNCQQNASKFSKISATLKLMQRSPSRRLPTFNTAGVLFDFLAGIGIDSKEIHRWTMSFGRIVVLYALRALLREG